MKQMVFVAGLALWITAGCAPVGSRTDLAPAGQGPLALYVAPDGNDRFPGTLDRPLGSLYEARDRLRRQARAVRQRGAVVYLRAGDYPFDRSLVFDTQDGGTPERPVRFVAWDNEPVKLIGGRTLPRAWFQPLTDPGVRNRLISPEARDRVVVTDLPARGIHDYGVLSLRGFPDHDPALPLSKRKQDPPMELFYAGRRMTIARWPNEGFVRMAEVVDPGPTWDWDRQDSPEFWQRGGTFRYDFDRPALWSQADDVWTNGILSKAWVWTFNRVAAIDPQVRTVTLRYGTAEGGLQMAEDAHFGNHFYFEHLLEEIDQPGEYYLDHATGRLYVWPPEGWAEGEEDFVASLLAEPMLEFDGAAHITLEGLVLEGGRDYAVRCVGSRGIGLKRCEIRNFTKGGLYIDAEETTVDRCHIHQIGGTAVHLLGGDFETLTPSGNVLSYCDIHDFGYWDKVYYPGITLRGVGQRVSHCRIHDGPHMGIMVYGNEQRIEANEIFGVPNMFRDMHAIYINLGDVPEQRGITIARNYFHDIGVDNDGGKQGAVYLDSSTNGITIEENLFCNIGTVKSDWTVMVHGGSYNVVRSNIFVDCVKPYFMAFWLTTWGKSWIPWYQKRWNALFEKYDFARMPHGRRYPELLRFLQEDRLKPDTNRFEDNVIYNPTRPVIGDPVEIKDAGPEILKQKNTRIIDFNPGFVDPARRDFRWVPDAKLFEWLPAMKAVSFDRAGIGGQEAAAGK